jgi:hypothetical protein
MMDTMSLSSYMKNIPGRLVTLGVMLESAILASPTSPKVRDEYISHQSQFQICNLGNLPRKLLPLAKLDSTGVMLLFRSQKDEVKPR